LSLCITKHQASSDTVTLILNHGTRWGASLASRPGCFILGGRVPCAGLIPARAGNRIMRSHSKLCEKKEHRILHLLLTKNIKGLLRDVRDFSATRSWICNRWGRTGTSTKSKRRLLTYKFLS